MAKKKKATLHGVIAAAPTPITDTHEPDLGRFVTLCRWLLDNGCDALNICGTNGEATSLTVEQRMAVMSAAAGALPGERIMCGTGAASVGDAVQLTEHAAALGFAGALLLPPFYYKGIPDDGIVGYFERIVAATQNAPIDLYLYNFPQLSCVEYSVPLIERLIAAFGSRIAGLKDSSGNLDYASSVASISSDLAVFPSTEAVLLKARAGDFAGCISGSANITSAHCAKAYHDGNAVALDRAVAIRTLVTQLPPVPAMKAVLAARLNDPTLATVLPPLAPLPDADARQLLADIAALESSD